MISTFFFLIFPSATSLSFNFTTFEPNNGQISFEGDARYSSDGDIELTRNKKDKSIDSSWGRAIYKEQLCLWDHNSRNLTDFTTNFSFVIDSLDNSTYADGLTFFLNGTQLPLYVSGENLGLTKDNVTNTTAIRFVAVEFDTFSNTGKRDPVSDHVGIDIKLHDICQNSATGKLFQINNVFSWNFSSTLQPPNPVEPGDGKKTGFVVGLSVCSFLVVCGLGLVWHHLRKKRNSGGEEDGTDSDIAMDEDFEKGTGARKFSFDELALATSNFAEEEKLGEGGFGGVYRGFLRELNTYVAVKRVSRGPNKG
ncbi:L-type lectin-domain containing receptor kinase IX.1 [Vitis vinifera]|uniref:L-type lectin-domain containing receptor kinase IX.1 n=1 Tax=Vitis vinifera TaxID=29760 RepID=A0A438JMT9_VITVI|nr:L-type lectin-domain containing receptor kinase IX.1 [Vitis vinifera]